MNESLKENLEKYREFLTTAEEQRVEPLQLEAQTADLDDNGTPQGPD